MVASTAPISQAITNASAHPVLELHKSRARAWFEQLRDDICAALEAAEDALPAGAPLSQQPAGRFARTPWSRTDHTGEAGGGGGTRMKHGRRFEEGGGHVSPPVVQV